MPDEEILIIRADQEFSVARDNSSPLPDDQDHPPRKTPTSVHFGIRTRQEPDWRYEETKCRRNTLAQGDRDNTATWRIDSREKLVTEIGRDLDGGLSMVSICGVSIPRTLTKPTKQTISVTRFVPLT